PLCLLSTHCHQRPASLRHRSLLSDDRLLRAISGYRWNARAARRRRHASRQRLLPHRHPPRPLRHYHRNPIPPPSPPPHLPPPPRHSPPGTRNPPALSLFLCFFFRLAHSPPHPFHFSGR